MIWNFGKGEVLKGNDVQLYIPLMPPCSPLTLDDVEDFTATFYTTIGGSAITKDLSDFTVSGVMGTIVLQAVELEALDDGVIRYNTHYTVTSTGMEEGYEFISSYFLKTPNAYTPIDFVTTAEVDEVVAEAIETSTAITEMVQEAVAHSGAITSGDCQSQIETAMAIETARTEETYLKEHQSLADYYTSAQTDQAISSALTNSGFITSGDCQSQIETAMTNVVMSEEIKTIWKGSQAQYDTMSGHSNNTLYIIV